MSSSTTRRLYAPLIGIVTVMGAILIIAAAGSAGASTDKGKDQQNYNPPENANIYGATWVSPERGVFHFASERDLSGAIAKAGNKCERVSTDCTPGVWVRNGYVALAMDSTGNWGTGWGKYSAAASTAAVNRCERKGGVACEVLRTKRTSFYNPYGATQGGRVLVEAGGGAGGGGGIGPG